VTAKGAPAPTGICHGTIMDIRGSVIFLLFVLGFYLPFVFVLTVGRRVGAGWKAATALLCTLALATGGVSWFFVVEWLAAWGTATWPIVSARRGTA